MSKRFLLVLAACIAIFAGLIFINKKDAGAPTSSGGEPTNHTFGEGSTGVTVTEYGDFQCPACFAYYPIFKQLKEEYGDRVTFGFRHFPIVSAHPNAMAAHRAAEAASRQGKFWEMHDMLYERQQSWQSSSNPSGAFEGYAEELGLDMEKYRQDIVDESTGANIQADFKSGEAAGVQGTPSFLINGQLIETPNSIDAFKQLIDDAIKEKAGDQNQ